MCCIGLECCSSSGNIEERFSKGAERVEEKPHYWQVKEPEMRTARNITIQPLALIVEELVDGR